MKLRPSQMKATFKMDPFPHVLLEDFFSKIEMDIVLDETRRLDSVLRSPEHSGSARHEETGQTLKHNFGAFLNDVISNSEIISLTRKHIYDELVEQIDCKWWVDVWKYNNAQSFMLSRYNDGQYYNCHSDLSQFTLLVWYHRMPRTFTGGDLIFTDFQYTIPCVNNTGIIFPGPLRHEVPPVQGTGRYTLTMFTNCQNPVLQKSK